MRVFTRVVEAGNFTRAAETLDMPRPTVTTAVQQLETHLGARLLNRTTRRVSVTQDGEAYYERCLHVLAELADAEAMLSDGSQPRGRLKVQLPARFARIVVMPVLDTFCQRYPHIDLDLGASDAPVDLVQQGVDCALRVGKLSDSSLVARRLGALTEINCAAPTYLARYGSPQTPADLDGHLAVNFHSGRTGRPSPWKYLQSGKRREKNLPGRMIVDSADAYVAAAIAGCGLIQAPLYGVATHLERGELEDVMPDYRPEPSPISVVYPGTRHMASRVRAFTAWLEEVIRATPGVVLSEPSFRPVRA